MHSSLPTSFTFTPNNFVDIKMDVSNQPFTVFKFGGASINTKQRIENVGNIITQYAHKQLVIIISAMGKTTNALEKVVEAFYGQNNQQALGLFTQIKDEHISLAKALLGSALDAAMAQLSNTIVEAEWMLHDQPVRPYDYYYDQIVPMGEMLSTILVSAYLQEQGIAVKWVDVRDIIRTDSNFRDANIDWAKTTENITELMAKQPTNHILTQGFVGATSDNESTTLGREGSDYTAAIFANILHAESMTIWKDVASVMNADPKAFADAISIPTLNYEEVIEMAYYGAQVIHPKTIKPLFQKKIPLFVKCFLNPALPGTVIKDVIVKHLPPIFILKQQQVLIQFRTTDFSFVGEKTIGLLYQLFETLNIRPNLTQNGAIRFLCCLDDKTDRIEKLCAAAADYFDINIERNLALLTIRNGQQQDVDSIINGKTILIKQETKKVMQILYSEA